MKPTFTATCKNCKKKIEWLKNVGWIHTYKGTCTNPVPIKDTVE